MSADSTTVTAAHFAYIAERTRTDDDLLRDLRAAANEAGIPAIQISPEQASFLQILLRLAGARDVVEVGTLAGYSAIAMARALPEGGRVRTIEVSQTHAEFARTWIAKSDVADRIEVLQGRGLDLLPKFCTDCADAIFLDADKKSYPAYLEEGLRIVRRGGLIMADNAFAFGQLFDEHPTDGEAAAMIEFNEVMAAEPRVQSVIVPLGDGCWIGVKQ